MAMLSLMLNFDATTEGVNTFSPLSSPITFLLFMSGMIIPRLFVAAVCWSAFSFFGLGSFGSLVLLICVKDLFFFPPPIVFTFSLMNDLLLIAFLIIT